MMLVQFIFSFIIWLLAAFVTLAFSVAIIACRLICWRDSKRKLSHSLANAWGETLFALNPMWKLKIQGRGYIRKGSAYVLVANHLSLSDIVCLYCLGKQFKWVAKESLFHIPFFGWAMSALGYIRLRRGEHGSIRDSFHESVRWLEKVMSFIIFPE